jgi:ankyrin repeat protein
MSSMSDSREPLEQIRVAFRADDWRRVGELLERHPEIKAMIDDPVGPFDSPAIVNARSPEMLDVLLAAGADLNAKSRWWAGGFGLLHGCSPELAAHAIERGATVDVHAAARLGMLDRLRELVTRDPGAVHARGGDGQTPLHFAATVEIADFLLDHGAEIDALDTDHESTPAQYLVGDRQELARFLVARGCKTDILMAAALGDADLVRGELDANPGSIRTSVSDDYFPMIDGRAGGTIYQWTLGFHMSAHRVARKFGRDDVLRLLIERSPPALTLIEACWLGDDEAVNALRAEQPEVAESLTAADRCQVAHAARNNETGAVRLMLESGLPADARGQHQATPLHWAAFHGNLGMIEAVLRFGPPLEATDADFSATPMGWAVHGSEHGWHCRTGDYAGTVEALLAAGAEQPASMGGSPAVQEVLRRAGQRRGDRPSATP